MVAPGLDEGVSDGVGDGVGVSDGSSVVVRGDEESLPAGLDDGASGAKIAGTDGTTLGSLDADSLGDKSFDADSAFAVIGRAAGAAAAGCADAAGTTVSSELLAAEALFAWSVAVTVAAYVPGPIPLVLTWHDVSPVT